ncbi:MAG: hypothetical protein QF926_10495 [Alphaproteobacteria bacterium]|jgi:hypothetical protein|nr:hypothetical protein [Alphaproteobacteria bacterium]MDP6517035.1 hypothetical protein [Alphaproteobacteria bacterium]
MRLIRRLFFLLLLVIVVGPVVLILVAIEDSPGVSVMKTLDTGGATRARDLAVRTISTLFTPAETASISASKRELNELMALMARGLGPVKGGVEVTEEGLKAVVTLHLPHNPLGDYINLRFGFEPSPTGLDLAPVALGRIEIPGAAVVEALRLGFDLVLGGAQGTAVVGSIRAVTFEFDRMTVALVPVPDLKESLQGVADRLAEVRDQVALLGDPAVVRAYYAKLMELDQNRQGAGALSLAEYVGPVFALARSRSAGGDPAAENQAAVLALAIYHGDRRFERLIGPVRTEEMKANEPRRRHVMLRDRQDLTLHFIISAGLEIVASSGVNLAIGEFKELLDAAGGGSGFSFSDLAADRTGARFAQVARDGGGGARRLQEVLAGAAEEDLFFPAIAGLPDGLTDAAFQSRFGGIDGAEYKKLVDEIDRRIAQRAAYRDG